MIEQQTGEPYRRPVASVQAGPRNLGNRPTARPGRDTIERAAQATERTRQCGVVDHGLHPAESRQQHLVFDDVEIELVDAELDRHGETRPAGDLSLEQHPPAQMTRGRLLGTVALKRCRSQGPFGVPDHDVSQGRTRILDTRETGLEVAPPGVEPSVRGEVEQAADRHLRHDPDLDVTVAEHTDTVTGPEPVTPCPERRHHEVTVGVDDGGHVGAQAGPRPSRARRR